MHSRNGDMRCIGCGFPKENTGSQNCSREMPSFGCNIEQSKVPDNQHSFARCPYSTVALRTPRWCGCRAPFGRHRSSFGVWSDGPGV